MSRQISRIVSSENSSCPPRKAFAGICHRGELDVLAEAHPAHVGLVGVELNPNVGQVRDGVDARAGLRDSSRDRDRFSCDSSSRFTLSSVLFVRPTAPLRSRHAERRRDHTPNPGPAGPSPARRLVTTHAKGRHPRREFLEWGPHKPNCRPRGVFDEV